MTTDKTPAEHLQIVRGAFDRIIKLGGQWAHTPHDYTLQMRDIAKQALPSIEALEEFLNNKPKGN